MENIDFQAILGVFLMFLTTFVMQIYLRDKYKMVHRVLEGILLFIMVFGWFLQLHWFMLMMAGIGYRPYNDIVGYGVVTTVLFVEVGLVTLLTAKTIQIIGNVWDWWCTYCAKKVTE